MRKFKVNYYEKDANKNHCLISLLEKINGMNLHRKNKIFNDNG